MDSSPRCPFAFQTEPSKDSPVKKVSFKEFLIQRQSGHKSSLPTVVQTKNRRWEKQLSSLLQPEVFSFRQAQLNQQIPLNEIVKVARITHTTTNNDQEQEFKKIKSESISIPLLNIPITPTNGFFKFQPQHRMRKTGMYSLRNCNEQLEQINRKQKSNVNNFSLPQLTQEEIITQFFQTKFQKSNENDELQHKPIGSSARLDYEANILFTKITSDYTLYQKYKGRHIKHLKEVYRSLLGVGYDKEIMMDPGRLKSIHSQLNIKNDQFLRFKYLFINQFLEMETPLDLFFKGCHKIESFKPLVLNKPLDFEIYGQDVGIKKITESMYDKIFKDYTLSPYFILIDKETQAKKFSRLFAQLIDHTDSPNYTLEILRERHVQYNLTLVQFANFKFYLSMTLQQQQIGFKHIRQLLRKMDTYKYAILNKESLQETINAFGYREFIDGLVKQCQTEPILYELFNKRGKHRFTAHCENMIHFFFRDNVKSITDQDIEQIHKCNSIISEKAFLKVKEHTFQTLLKITKDALIISDFEEDWEEITPFILNRSKKQIVKQLGGQTFISNLASTLAFEMQQRPQLNKVFEDNDTCVAQNLRCKLNLMLYGIHFYKKTELEVLHKRLKISEQVYFEFQQATKHILENFPKLQWLNRVLEDYKKHINTQSQLKQVHLRSLQNYYQLIENKSYQSQINENLSRLLEALYTIITIVDNQKISNWLKIYDMYKIIILLNMPQACRSQGMIAIQTQQQDSEINNHRFKQIIDSPSYKNSNHLISYEKSSFSQHFRITSQRSSPQQKKVNLIRNHQLLVDVVKGSDKIKNDLCCPHSPQLQKSQQQIISGYLKDLARKRRVVQKPQGIDARLDFETELIYSALTQDGDLAKKFYNKTGSHVKQIFRSILATGYDQQIYLDLNRIRSIHLGLNLKSFHFFRFKYHFMNRFMQMGIPVEQLFKCCERIENVRPYILNEKMEYDVYGGQDGIELCANQMYAKIFADITLEYYFVGIDRATQASKFAKLFFQLIYHMDSPNYTNEVLRERHVKYELTNVQLTNFKFYLALTLQELQVPFKYASALLRRMDIYKYAVINKNSLQDYICNYGYNLFIEQFVKSCLEEPVLYDLIQRRGKAKFTGHCENIFHYFFRYNVKAITLDDLEEIHYHKTIITEKIFMKLKEKAMVEVGKLTDDRIVLEDFDEDWDEIKPLILSDPRMSYLKIKDRDVLINELAYNLENEFYSRQLNVIYETEEINMMRNIKSKLNLLVYTIKFFKRTDLEVIHRRFRISESQYFDFQQSFRSLLEKVPELHYIHGLLEEYKKYIVSD
ncbi:unnamed protein product [Paramecium sonneborni]|uniref:Uncharacterized protein n=1 Tax=Paramecium sonneborni TaxID=65129 RepID=A0A8S1N325_9CILI|nr:unnamed protein product [Paramecium sonneborni]